MTGVARWLLSQSFASRVMKRGDIPEIVEGLASRCQTFHDPGVFRSAG
jgi:hypothetical protein